MSETVHASVALVGDRGVLIRGPSGSGKSSLLLALIAVDAERSALVADDRVSLDAVNGRVIATVPEAIAGMVELRGQGILRRPFISPVVVDLVVDLVAPVESPRMPGPGEQTAEVAGVYLPRLALPTDCDDKTLRVGVALQQSSPRNAS
jgi:serine kinase of HPr protein (carbohydrate metabolism regulator)